MPEASSLMTRDEPRGQKPNAEKRSTQQVVAMIKPASTEHIVAMVKPT
jgi:hypothetical protein